MSRRFLLSRAQTNNRASSDFAAGSRMSARAVVDAVNLMPFLDDDDDESL